MTRLIGGLLDIFSKLLFIRCEDALILIVSSNLPRVCASSLEVNDRGDSKLG